MARRFDDRAGRVALALCVAFGVVAVASAPPAWGKGSGGPDHPAISKPDPRLTQGATRGAVTQQTISSTICTFRYADRVGSVSAATRSKVFAEYRVTRTDRPNYLIDHLVPLELGGSNDIRNLWPQPVADWWSKQSVTAAILNERVCSEGVPLAVAQHAVVANWRTALTVATNAAQSAGSAPCGAPASLPLTGATELAPGIPAPTPVSEQATLQWQRTSAPIAVGNGLVWVATNVGIAAVDPLSFETMATIATDHPVVAVVTSRDGTWVVSGSDTGLNDADNPPYTLERIDPLTLRAVFTVQLPFTSGYHSSWHIRLAASAGTAWVTLGQSALRVDAASGTVTSVSLGPYFGGNIAADATGLWIAVSGADGSNPARAVVLHVDRATNEIRSVPGLALGFSWSLASSGDAAWLVEIYTEPDTSATVMHLVRIDAASFAITAFRVPAIAVVVGDGQIWVQVDHSTNGQEDVRCVAGQVDPATGRIVRTVSVTLGPLPGNSGDGYNNPPFAVADGRVWSASNGLQRTTL